MSVYDLNHPVQRKWNTSAHLLFLMLLFSVIKFNKIYLVGKMKLSLFKYLGAISNTNLKMFSYWKAVSFLTAVCVWCTVLAQDGLTLFPSRNISLHWGLLHALQYDARINCVITVLRVSAGFRGVFWSLWIGYISLFCLYC